jgi:hypothetical protein
LQKWRENQEGKIRRITERTKILNQSLSDEIGIYREHLGGMITDEDISLS